MITEITVDNFQINELEKKFPQVWGIKGVKEVLIDNPFSHIYIYSLDSQIIAFIHYDIIYERSELIQIYVLEKYQNQKIASQLMNYMIGNCKKQQVKNITLEVNINNRIAIHLYEKYGFHQVALRKGYYQGVDGILMEKEMIE